jgi:hypothetical protein
MALRELIIVRCMLVRVLYNGTGEALSLSLAPLHRV